MELLLINESLRIIYSEPVLYNFDGRGGIEIKYLLTEI